MGPNPALASQAVLPLCWGENKREKIPFLALLHPRLGQTEGVGPR